VVGVEVVVGSSGSECEMLEPRSLKAGATILYLNLSKKQLGSAQMVSQASGSTT
jgi:hypothetical protein